MRKEGYGTDRKKDADWQYSLYVYFIYYETCCATYIPPLSNPSAFYRVVWQYFVCKKPSNVSAGFS